MQMSNDDRERHVRELAAKLFFTVGKNGGRFTLRRHVDVSAPVAEENLTLEEAEAFLDTWKLRGLHGG